MLVYSSIKWRGNFYYWSFYVDKNFRADHRNDGETFINTCKERIYRSITTTGFVDYNENFITNNWRIQFNKDFI